jgi:hypothetical protein
MKLSISTATPADAPRGRRLVHRKAPVIYFECVL